MSERRADILSTFTRAVEDLEALKEESRTERDRLIKQQIEIEKELASISVSEKDITRVQRNLSALLKGIPPADEASS